MTKTEIKTIFKNYLVLLVDSNEQKNHVRKYFESKGVRTLTYNMKSADYSFLILPNHLTGTNVLYFGDKFLIERKSGKREHGGGFSELRNNLVKGHQQFKDEFKRVQNVDQVYLLIENSTSSSDINLVPQRKLHNSTFVKIFESFLRNRNNERVEVNKKAIELVYCENIEISGEVVMRLIFEYIKDCL